MNSNTRNSGLRRALFAGGLAATALAAALSPDWAAVLKAQGYYGNVDLRIMADISGDALEPGQEVLLPVVVTNQGPDTAHRVRTSVAMQNLEYIATFGCNGIPHPSQCNLADSLAAGETADYLLQLRVPYHARHHVQFSASAASDDIEIQPGDEIALLKRRLHVPVNLRSEIACQRKQQRQDRTVRCSITFRNAGSHPALRPALLASVSEQGPLPVRWSCDTSHQPGECASAQATSTAYTLTPSLLAYASYITFFADIPLQGTGPITLDASAALNSQMGETELNAADNGDRLIFEPSLFFDGFDLQP